MKTRHLHWRFSTLEKYDHGKAGSAPTEAAARKPATLNQELWGQIPSHADAFPQDKLSRRDQLITVRLNGRLVGPFCQDISDRNVASS